MSTAGAAEAAPAEARGPCPGQTRVAVLGFPAAHSLSPVIHRRGFELAGLDRWSYDIIELQPDALPAFLDGLDDSWRGFSVTMPLKSAAARLGICDPLVAKTGVANTLVIDHTDDGPVRRAYNTDVEGFVRAIRGTGVATLRSAVVIGSGATALSAMMALGSMGARVTLSARNADKAATLAKTGAALGLDTDVSAWGQYKACDVAVSTIPAHATEHLGALVAARPGLIFDVIYHPWPTPLATAAHAAEIPVLSGLDLLVHQATAQFALFTGRTVPAEPLLLAVRSAATARAQA